MDLASRTDTSHPVLRPWAHAPGSSRAPTAHMRSSVLPVGNGCLLAGAPSAGHALCTSVRTRSSRSPVTLWYGHVCVTRGHGEQRGSTVGRSRGCRGRVGEGGTIRTLVMADSSWNLWTRTWGTRQAGADRRGPLASHEPGPGSEHVKVLLHDGERALSHGRDRALDHESDQVGQEAQLDDSVCTGAHNHAAADGWCAPACGG